MLKTLQESIFVLTVKEWGPGSMVSCLFAGSRAVIAALTVKKMGTGSIASCMLKAH